jgi:hypothetical protein
MTNHHTEEGANDVVDKPTNEDEEGKSLLHGVKLDLDDRAIKLTQLTMYTLLHREKPSHRRRSK